MTDTAQEASYRAEARRELARIVGREYWRGETPSAPAPGSGGSTPPRGLRPGDRPGGNRAMMDGETVSETVRMACVSCGAEFAVPMGRGRCGCGVRQVWEASRGTTASAGHCEVTGAHTILVHEVGCERHAYYGGTLGEPIGRYCPAGCDWAQGEHA